MYDTNLRVISKIWLLEVQIWKRNLKEALPLALNLACRVFDQLRNTNFAPETIHAMELQSLNRSNILLPTGDIAAFLKNLLGERLSH